MTGQQLVQAAIDIVFKGNMIYLAPFLFLLMTILFADRLVDLIYEAIQERRRYR
jgi:hypothetical protein